MSAQKIVVGSFFVLACLATLVAGLFVFEDFRGRAAWREYETAARARGTSLRLESYLPPMPPDDQNFAAVPMFADLFSGSEEKKKQAARAFALPDGDRPDASDPARGQRANLSEWAAFLAVDPHLMDESKPAADRLLAALARYAHEDAELRVAAARPACRFPVKWEDGLSALLPHLAVLMNAARINGLRLEAHAAQGNPAVHDDYRLGMRLVTALDKEPVLIDGLVRLALARHLANALWSSLATDAWDEAGLREIETGMANLHLLADWRFSVESERAAMNGILEQFAATNREERRQILQAATTDPRARFAWAVLPRGWLLQNMLRMNQYVDEVTAQIRAEEARFRPAPTPHAFPQTPNAFERFYYSMSSLVVPAFERVQQKFMETHIVVAQVQTACALERFRRAHGAYPDALAQMVPAFLNEVPRDVIDGEPLRYRREGERGYVLYSIAQNQRDDGGLTGKKSEQDRPDWVWRFP